MSTPSDERANDITAVPARNLRFGWWALLIFLAMGILLEALHGLKVGAYLDVGNHTRRAMWTLAHAHGALFSRVNIAFALTLRSLGLADAAWTRLASITLIAGSVCVPGGFFLGGLFFWRGDPGLGIVLAPIGGLLLLISVITTARGVQAATREWECFQGLGRMKTTRSCWLMGRPLDLK
jgi:hypothetical protein